MGCWWRQCYIYIHLDLNRDQILFGRWFLFTLRRTISSVEPNGTSAFPNDIPCYHSPERPGRISSSFIYYLDETSLRKLIIYRRWQCFTNLLSNESISCCFCFIFRNKEGRGSLVNNACEHALPGVVCNDNNVFIHTPNCRVPDLVNWYMAKKEDTVCKLSCIWTVLVCLLFLLRPC